MKLALALGALLLAAFGFGSRARANQAPPPPPRPARGSSQSSATATSSSLPASSLRGPLPGVPAALQRSLPPASTPRAPIVDLPVVAPTYTVEPSPSTMQTRLSVQPAELPSTPLAHGMTVAQRAVARDRALAAAFAVRGQGPALRAGVQPVPLAPVAVFQQAVGLRTDGKWGRETRSYAVAFTGRQDLPREVW